MFILSHKFFNVAFSFNDNKKKWHWSSKNVNLSSANKLCYYEAMRHLTLQVMNHHQHQRVTRHSCLTSIVDVLKFRPVFHKHHERSQSLVHWQNKCNSITCSSFKYHNMWENNTVEELSFQSFKASRKGSSEMASIHTVDKRWQQSDRVSSSRVGSNAPPNTL